MSSTDSLRKPRGNSKKGQKGEKKAFFERAYVTLEKIAKTGKKKGGVNPKMETKNTRI